MPLRIRLCIALGAGTLLFGAMVAAFWYQDWRYSLPTPRPLDLRQPEMGSHPGLPPALAMMVKDDPRPLFLHFFNPRCPCSRFNLEHVRRLSQTYAGRARFVAILEGKSGERALLEAFTSAHLPMDAIPDTHGEVARALGVYSTPQAVLLDARRHLAYRGNYNLSRYCSEPETEFARIALDSLLAATAVPAHPEVAATAYGCPLPAGWAYPGKTP